MAIQPGDIYWMKGVPKPRPVVVVSREEMNRGRYLVGVPLTSRRIQDRWDAPSCVCFSKGEANLDRDCVAQAEAVSQMMVSDLDIENGWVGSLGEDKLDALIAAIGYVLSAEYRRL